MAMELFLGTAAQSEEFYRSKGKEAPAGLTITKKEEEQKGHRGQSPDCKLDLDSLPPMDEEELYNLKRIRLRNDSDTVYMQSDVDFYDYFYKEGEQIDPLTKAAHQIKRVYMNAEDYFYALDVRDAYIDMVIERDFDGNQYRFNKAMNNGDIYIPPTPFYSKRAPDYEVVMAGGRIEYNTDPELDAEKILEWVNEWWENEEMSPDDIHIIDDVLSDVRLLDEIGSDSNQKGQLCSNGTMVMSVTDIRAVQSTLNDIYQNRNPSKNGSSRLFSKTPARIREEYQKSIGVPVADLYAEVLSGEDENREDYNAMTYDPVTNRPMTVGELKKRTTVRNLVKLGWSELAMMRALNVGSAYERRRLSEDRANIRKLKKSVARSLEHQLDFNDNPYTAGRISPENFDPMEELQRYFGGKA